MHRAHHVVAADREVIAVGADDVQRLVIRQREREGRRADVAIGLEVGVLRVGAQLGGGRLAGVVALERGQGVVRDVELHHLVGDVDVGQHHVGVRAGEQEVGEVRAAVGEEVERGPAVRVGLAAPEEAQELHEIGGRSVHRAALLALAHVRAAEEQRVVRQDRAHDLGRRRLLARPHHGRGRDGGDVVDEVPSGQLGAGGDVRRALVDRERRRLAAERRRVRPGEALARDAGDAVRGVQAAAHEGGHRLGARAHLEDPLDPHQLARDRGRAVAGGRVDRLAEVVHARLREVEVGGPLEEAGDVPLDLVVGDRQLVGRQHPRHALGREGRVEKALEDAGVAGALLRARVLRARHARAVDQLAPVVHLEVEELVEGGDPAVGQLADQRLVVAREHGQLLGEQEPGDQLGLILERLLRGQVLVPELPIVGPAERGERLREGLALLGLGQRGREDCVKRRGVRLLVDQHLARGDAAQRLQEGRHLALAEPPDQARRHGPGDRRRELVVGPLVEDRPGERQRLASDAVEQLVREIVARVGQQLGVGGSPDRRELELELARRELHLLGRAGDLAQRRPALLQEGADRVHGPRVLRAVVAARGQHDVEVRYEARLRVVLAVDQPRAPRDEALGVDGEHHHVGGLALGARVLPVVEGDAVGPGGIRGRLAEDLEAVVHVELRDRLRVSIDAYPAEIQVEGEQSLAALHRSVGPPHRAGHGERAAGVREAARLHLPPERGEGGGVDHCRVVARHPEPLLQRADRGPRRGSDRVARDLLGRDLQAESAQRVVQQHHAHRRLVGRDQVEKRSHLVIPPSNVTWRSASPVRPDEPDDAADHAADARPDPGADPEEPHADRGADEGSRPAPASVPAVTPAPRPHDAVTAVSVQSPAMLAVPMPVATAATGAEPTRIAPPATADAKSPTMIP